MKLSDIMSAAGLSSWAEIGLILSVVTFSAIVIWVFVVRRKPSYEHLRELPLEDDNPSDSTRIPEGGSPS
jgi:hypothetical protein